MPNVLLTNYEDKIKAKSKVKELMQLRSIGLLDDNTWNELGFSNYKNDVKSEIEVDDFLNKYNQIKERYIGYLTTDKSRRIFKELGFKSLFLAKVLKKLELEMVNGRILNKYNAVFVKKLLQMENEDLEVYKTELLTRKDDIINNLSSDDDVLLKKFFELTVVIKTLNAIKTNGFTRTIPEFQLWLKEQKNGLLGEYYNFDNYYLKLIDKVLNAVPDRLLASLKSNNTGDSMLSQDEIDALWLEADELIAPIRKELSNKYLDLFDEVDTIEYDGSEIGGGYDRIYLIYNELEIIELINRSSRFIIRGENIALKKANLIMDLKEIDVADFEYEILNKSNLFYDHEDETNLFYLYNIYKENTVNNFESGLEELVSSTITVIKNLEKTTPTDFTPKVDEVVDYSKVTDFLAIKPEDKVDNLQIVEPTTKEISSYYKVNDYNSLTKIHTINYTISEELLEDMKMQSNVNYYLSDLLINNHYLKYEMVGELIKNLSFSEKLGVNYENWVNAANENEMEGNNIWEILSIDRNSLLEESADKDIDLVKILENYKKLTDSVKKSLNLEVNLYSENYGTSTMFFDPITTMLLSKNLVDKGYYIDAGEDGYDHIFNRDGNIVELHMEIDGIIEAIKAKKEDFRSEFGGLFASNDYLGGLLDNMNSETRGNMNDMMNFINFSYSVDIRTGEMNGSLDFGVMGLNDKLWDRITASMGQKSMGGLIARGLYEGVKIIYPYFMGYMIGEGTNFMLQQQYRIKQEGIEIELRTPFRTDSKIFISDFNRSVKNYTNSGISKEQARLKVIGDYEATARIDARNYDIARSNYNNANKAVGVAERALTTAENEHEKLGEKLKKLIKELFDLYYKKNNAATDKEKEETNTLITGKMKTIKETEGELEKSKKNVEAKKKDLQVKKATSKEKKKTSDKANKKAVKSQAEVDQAKEANEPKKKKSCALMSDGSEY